MGPVAWTTARACARQVGEAKGSAAGGLGRLHATSGHAAAGRLLPGGANQNEGSLPGAGHPLEGVAGLAQPIGMISVLHSEDK
jgi:hypothetical protein